MKKGKSNLILNKTVNITKPKENSISDIMRNNNKEYVSLYYMLKSRQYDEAFLFVSKKVDGLV